MTITKTGPAMLSLDGQQSYKPGSKLVIAEGLVRMHTDPGAGGKVADDAGPYLTIEVQEGGKLHFAADAKLKAIHLAKGAHLSIEQDVTVELTDALEAQDGTTVEGEVQIKSNAVNQP